MTTTLPLPPGVTAGDAGVGAPGSGLSCDEIRVFLARLAELDRDVSDAERLRRIGLLEAVKGAAAGAQAVDARDFDASQRAGQVAAGVPADRVGAGVAHQVATARRESPWRGSRHLGLAKVLPEMPCTEAALMAGRISEWRATIVARSTATLSLEDRREVDARLANRLEGLSDRQLGAAADAIAYELDAEAPLRRARTAEADRHVSVRPAPDVMAVVSGFVPVAQGVAVKKSLREAATALKAAGGTSEVRSVGQIEADLFVQRLTGQAVADDVSIEVGLVMTDTTLLAGGMTPARLECYGPIPAVVARGLLRPSMGTGLQRKARVFLRRLFTDPVDGAVVERDSRKRLFRGAVRELVIARDQQCRTPYCDAPIRDVDHVIRATDGGTCDVWNGQGLCQRCNQAKEAAGWTANAFDDPDHTHLVLTVRGEFATATFDTSAAPPALPTYRPPPSMWELETWAEEAPRFAEEETDSGGVCPSTPARARCVEPPTECARGEAAGVETRFSADAGIDGGEVCLARDPDQSVEMSMTSSAPV